MPWDAGDDQPRDFTPPGLWARLTAEPRAGWYSWQAAAPTAAGGWVLLPADGGFPYGAAGATTAGDRLPARGANAETGLAVGTAAGRVVWLEFDPVTPGYRFAVGGATGVLVPVKQTAVTATAADTDTAATVQKFNATGGLADDAEAVVFRPKDSGQLQKVGTVWWCVDTGTRTTDTPPKRKLIGVVPPLVKRQIQVGCDGTTGNPLYASVWVPDVN